MIFLYFLLSHSQHRTNLHTWQCNLNQKSVSHSINNQNSSFKKLIKNGKKIKSKTKVKIEIPKIRNWNLTDDNETKEVASMHNISKN